jgi:hypothetical protein
MSEGNGTRVTAQDLDDDSATDSRVIKDSYSIVTDGDCYVHHVQAYPKSGTHVITVKGIDGKTGSDRTDDARPVQGGQGRNASATA